MLNTVRICSCQCGHVKFGVKGEHWLGMLCHCSICQKFNQTTYADVLIFKNSQITAPDSVYVAFRTYKVPPDAQRGTCYKRDQPTTEVFDFPLLLKITMVPAYMFVENSKLQNPQAYMFYENRVTDTGDVLSKYSGFYRASFNSLSICGFE